MTNLHLEWTMRDKKNYKYKTNSRTDRVGIGGSLHLLKCTVVHYGNNTIKRVHINGCQRLTGDGPDTRQ